jgi:hypothetical protein
MYDQLAVLGPLLLALTAGTPILQVGREGGREGGEEDGLRRRGVSLGETRYMKVLTMAGGTCVRSWMGGGRCIS